MRLLIAECKQEVSTFNPHLSRYEDFAVRRGEQLVAYHRQVRNEVGGALSVFDQHPDLDIVPTYSAHFITSGGTLREACWQTIAGEFLEAIDKASRQGPVDGIYLSMHGAMASQQQSDPEGYLLEQIAGRFGSAIPIVVSLDLHGILTDRMLRHCDAVVPYHTYPHVDFYETGARAARLLLRILDGSVTPVTARVTIPALVRGDQLITETGLFGNCMRMAQQLEATNQGLSAGMFISNPFTDVPELQTSSIVVADGDPAWASQQALRMATLFWEHHQAMQVPLISLDAMASQLCEAHRKGEPGTWGLVDAADATSSGASGDSNEILRALLQAHYRGSVLLPIVDAPAVTAAFAAGVGQRLMIPLGGSLDPQRFSPIPLEVRVRMLGDGRLISESFGERWDAGPTAVLESGSMTIVATSRAVSLYDRTLFLAHGQDPRRFDAVVIKSPHCQFPMYAQWCRAMIGVDAEGSSSANLKRLGHQRCPRPIFPLDPDVSFVPKVLLYQRKLQPS